MKKRKCMCMIFIFSSLCSRSRTLLPYCLLSSFAKSTVTLTSGPAVAICVYFKKGKQTFRKTENFVPLEGPGLLSGSTTTSSSTSPPEGLSLSSDPTITLRHEVVAGNCSKEVAGNCSTDIREWLEDFVVTLQSKRQCTSTKFQPLAWVITTSRKKSSKHSEN